MEDFSGSALGGFRLHLHLGGGFSAFVQRQAPLFFDYFVALLTHRFLYFVSRLSLLGENMKTRLMWFNLFLLLALATGCASTKSKMEKSTLRLHFEIDEVNNDRAASVPIFRANPMYLNVEKEMVCDERNIVGATVIDQPGGFAIQILFDRQGSWLLEQATLTHKGRRLAIFSHFGEARWLAAPVINRIITNGKLVFTPDATREEAERIVRGLNNGGKKSFIKDDF